MKLQLDELYGKVMHVVRHAMLKEIFQNSVTKYITMYFVIKSSEGTRFVCSCLVCVAQKLFMHCVCAAGSCLMIVWLICIQ